MDASNNQDIADQIETLRSQQTWLISSFHKLLDALEMKHYGATSGTVIPRSSGVTSDPILRAIADIRQSEPNT